MCDNYKHIHIITHQNNKDNTSIYTEWWGTGVVICLERGADLQMAQLMPLPLTVSCSSKIQIGFTFLVPAYPGCPGKEAVKWLLLLLYPFTPNHRQTPEVAANFSK